MMRRLRWALNIIRCARIRHDLTFGKRVIFDQELCPIVGDCKRIAYPDAFYHITADDVIRALNAIKDVEP